jgi:hypothetical protein
MKEYRIYTWLKFKRLPYYENHLFFYLKTHSSVFIIFLYNFGCYHCYQHFSIVALEDNDGIDERKKKV